MGYMNSDGQLLRGRAPKPWYRASTNSWYVMMGGRQIALGRDQTLAQEKFHRLRESLGFKENPSPRKIRLPTKKKHSITTFIYFVQDVETKNIKIGITESPKQRLGTLQSGNANELILLGAIRGLPGDEFDLHRKFSEFRIRGEWFRYDQSIIDMMDHLIENYEPFRL